MSTTSLARSPAAAHTPVDAALTLTGVRRSYATATRLNLLTGRRVPSATFEAVRGVDLSVSRGELFALLGTNGAGKTSTVDLVLGLAAPTAGQVRVLGHDPVRERALVRPRTGVVLQSGGYPSGLTVAETARMWHGTLTTPADAAVALEAVHLAHRVEVPVQRLSGGEQRRLDLALAIMGRPELLVLDEPTTGLDPESRRTVWQLVDELVKQGTTVLLTTHYLDEVEGLADRVAIMREGEIAATGTVAQIVDGSPSRITFDATPSLAMSDLDLPGARVTASDRVEIETSTLQDTLARVLAWAGDVPMPRLEARAASLEQVFLSIADTQEDR